MDDNVRDSAQTVWDYMVLNQPVRSADVLLVLGSRDDRVAEYAAKLCREFSFGQVLISGGAAPHNPKLAIAWEEPTEAAHFLNVMHHAGYDGEALLDVKAANTGENAVFSYKLLEKQGSTTVKSLLIVTKPYMERRALATFEAQWLEKTTRLHVTSPQLGLADYVNDEHPFREVVVVMLGDLQRIIDYPARGFQSTQHVPKQVLDAAEQLRVAGYTKHL